MELKNKVVLITGSSSGIGEATAKLFAKEGAKVVVNCKNSVEEGENVVSEIQLDGGEAILVQADVSKEEEVKNLFDSLKRKFGDIDILVNNAGVARPKAFLETTYEDWINEFNDNLFGTVLCSQVAAKIMLAQNKGKILNTSSIRGLFNTGREGLMPYSAAKSAVNSFTKTLAKQLAPSIQVNAVAPGFTYTPFYDTLSDELKQTFIDGTLTKKFVDVKEIAEAFLYLATADSVTGEILIVDGGFTLKQG